MRGLHSRRLAEGPITRSRHTLFAFLVPGYTHGRAMVAFVGGVLALGLLWTSPASPWALGLGDALIGLGRPEAAVRHYDRVARYGPVASIQQAALRRAAQVSAVELSSPSEARLRIEQLQRHRLDAHALATTWAQLAVLSIQERRPLDAAAAWRRAHDTAPDAARASQRLMEAAVLLASAGRASAAEELWVEVARLHPEHRARAQLGRAQILLARGDEHDALDLFEEAVAGTSDPGLVAVAHLGAATCLERLGDLNEALAELDAAAVSEDLRSSRGLYLHDPRRPRR